MRDLRTVPTGRGNRRGRRNTPPGFVVGPEDMELDAPPTFAITEAAVRQAVAELGRAGSLSAETAEVLDSRIEAWRAQWVERLRDQHTRTRDVAQQLINEAQAGVRQREIEHRQAERQLAEAEHYYEHASARLGVPGLLAEDDQPGEVIQLPVQQPEDEQPEDEQPEDEQPEGPDDQPDSDDNPEEDR